MACLSCRPLTVALATVLAATALTACTAQQPATSEAGVTVTTSPVTAPDAGALQKAADDYKAYVVGQADELVGATARFVAAIKSGDAEGAKVLYPISRAPWERIETVAQSLPGDLDRRINLRQADLQTGQKWTGFHRLERDLWMSGLQLDSTAIADRLLTDVTELRATVAAPEFRLDATQIAGNAQGLLDEMANSKIAGEEDIFSLTDLWDFHANVEGSQAAVAAVRPIVDKRDAELGKRSDERFAELNRLLSRYREGDGFVAYTSVTEPERQELSAALAALSNEVRQVYGIVTAQ